MKFKGFDITIESMNLVDDIMKKEFETLNQLKRLLKQHKRETKEFNILKKQIVTLKYSLSNKAFMVYKVLIKQKQNYYYECYVEYPTADDIRQALNTFKSKLRAKRKRSSEVEADSRSILGYEYETVGGVFVKPGSIISIQNNTDQMRRIQTPKKPAKQFKNNYIGIELELFCKLDRPNLLRKFVEARLAGYIYVKDDGSLRPENNYYPHEVTILCRQDDVKDIVPKIIKVLRSPDCDAAVNNSCGMHIHIDARNRDPIVMYDRLVRALPLLTKLVPKDRTTNRYCMYNTCSDLKSYYIDGKIENGPTNREQRYHAINPVSIASHKTIEVRLHSGTLNAEKIINWIDICTSIVDKEFDGQLSIPENFYWSIKKDMDLLQYMIKRSTLFDKGPIIDTRADYVMDIAAGF